jgi:hypothetical protein
MQRHINGFGRPTDLPFGLAAPYTRQVIPLQITGGIGCFFPDS